MALVITPLVSTPLTTNVTAYVSGSFTPAANSLLVAMVQTTATAGTGTMTGGSLTWTLKGSGTWGSTVGGAYIFYAKVGSSPASMTATFTRDTAGTGCVIQVFQVTGYNTAVSDPIRQVQFNPTTAANAPINFGGNTLGDSGIIFSVTAARNPIGATLGTDTTPGFTLAYDTGYATPTMGMATAYRSNGINGNQYGLTFAAITAMVFGVEIAAPIVTSPVRYIRDWENGSDLASGSYWAEVNGYDEFGTSLGPTSTYTFSGPTTETPPTTSYLYNHIYGNTAGVEVPAAGLNNVVMDFGSLKALSQIQILRYPSGTFNGTKTEVSPDGQTWYTAFDSAASGTYVEAGFGRMFSVPVYTYTPGTVYSDGVSEAAAATDTEVMSLTIASSSTEALTGSETLSVTGVANAVQTDTAASVDNINSTLARPGVVSEPNTANDSSSTLVSGTGAISEAATASETRSVSLVTPVAISEPVTPTDAENVSAVFTATDTETVTAGDILGYIQTLSVAISEAGSLDHAQTTGSTTSAATSEPATGAETVTAGTTTPSAISEPVTPAESQSTTTLFAALANEAGTLADQTNRVSVVIGVASEVVSTVDTTSNLRTTVSAITESGSVTDVPTSIATLGAAVSEAANGVDNISIGSSSSALTLEFASATGNGTATFNISAAGTDAANPADTGDSVKISAGLSAIFETLTPAESSSPIVNLNADRTESNTSTDQVFARVDFVVSVSELANLREIIFLNSLSVVTGHMLYRLEGMSIVFPATGKARNYPLYGKNRSYP